MQKLIRRLPGAAKPAAAVAPPAAKSASETPSPIRRLRFTSASAADAAQKRAELQQLLHLIAEQDDAIDAAVEARTAATAKIEPLLRELRLDSFSTDRRRAEFSEVWSRQSTYIDPKRLKAKVTDKVFWECIKVLVGDVEKHLSKKEFVDLCDIKEATLTGHVVKVVDLEKKKK